MILFYRCVCALIVLLAAVIGAPHLCAQSYKAAYDAFVGLSLDPTEVYTVSNVVFQREAADFTLDTGTIILTRPIAGTVRALVFSGRGHFSFQPPTSVEQDQLERYYQTRGLQVEASSIVMFVADSTVEELRSMLKKGGVFDNSLPSTLAEAVWYLCDRDKQSARRSVLWPILEDKLNGAFYAQINSDEAPLFFSVDPHEEEEVSLLRLAKGMRIGTYAHDVICQFHTLAEHLTGIAADEQKEVLRVDKYTIDISLSTSVDMHSKTQLQFTGLADGVRWIPFSLYSELNVTSAVWSSGAEAEYFKGDESTVLWVRLPQPMKKGESYTLNVSYDGGAMNRYGDWLVLWSSIGWYPIYNYKDKALFDVTYHFPSRYELAAVGEQKREETDEDAEIKTSQWVTAQPVRNYSFNIGKFTRMDITDPKLPAVSLYTSDNTTKAMQEDVKIDITTSLAFFQEVYGKLPINRFCAAPIPLAHGEAFPGLINLSSSTFGSNNQSGQHEAFRAHEVAHQWWGIGVDFKTYHDQWLSEAFAEYSGLMYMQLIRKDNKLFFKELEKWRDRIVDNRSTIFGQGVQAGPIWLGYRTRTSSTENDYNLIIYSKGAWVLHMLRNILLDMRTMREDRFFAMMKEFYSTYQGKEATTDDFHGIVEKYVGMDMDWFFNQWVYTTAVPKYTYAYKTDKLPDGKYQVTMRVKQENVPEGFQMPVPLLVDLGDGNIVRLRIMVSKAQEDILLPPLPAEPEEIQFNIFSSVLCEVEEDEWE